MKYLALLTLSLMFYVFPAWSQSVGIGTNSPQSSAILDLSSSSKGLLAPRMTTAQRTAILSPATGLLLYDTDNNSYWYYNGSSWNSFGSNNGGGLVLPYQASANTISPAFKITNSNTGAAIAGITTHEYGVGVTGTTTSPYGWGINGFARSPGAIAIYANADSATAIKATSVHGIGLDIISTNNSAIRILNNNGQPAIQVSNVHMGGTAIQASTANNHAIVATSGGTSKAAVWGEANGPGGNGIYGKSTHDAGYGVYGYNLTGTAVYGASNTGTAIKATSNSGLALDVNGKLKIAGGNTNPSHGAVLTSDGSGNATWKNNRIAFSAKGVNGNYVGLAHDYSTKIHFSTEEYDYGNDYVLHVGTNPVFISSTFTIPVSGVYHFDSRISVFGSDDDFIGGAIILKLSRNGSQSTIAVGLPHINNYYSGFYGAKNLDLLLAKDVHLLANDIIWIEVSQVNDGDAGATIATSSAACYFNGHLVLAD